MPGLNHIAQIQKDNNLCWKRWNERSFLWVCFKALTHFTLFRNIIVNDNISKCIQFWSYGIIFCWDIMKMILRKCHLPHSSQFVFLLALYIRLRNIECVQGKIWIVMMIILIILKKDCKCKLNTLDILITTYFVA